MDKNPSFIVVIRSSKERTEKLCKKLVQKQVDQQKIIIIYETPFKKALEECYRLALKEQTEWLITVDADMLLLPGALEQLILEAEKMPLHYFQLQGRIFDKITGDIRKAGPRIYRVAFLKKALLFSEKSEEKIRPESYVISAMSDEGHPSRYISSVTCIHDFEQFYVDIYRKSIVHAYKHEEIISKIILRAAKKKDNDNDFRVIIRAVFDGLMKNQKVFIDNRLFKEQAYNVLNELDLNEKDELSESFDLNLILSEKTLKDLIKKDSEINFYDEPRPQNSIYRKLINISKKKGVVGGTFFFLGTILIKIGKSIKR